MLLLTYDCVHLLVNSEKKNQVNFRPKALIG
jgi:hypothetical protein